VKADDRRRQTISVKATVTTTSSAARVVNACRLPRLSLYLRKRGETEADGKSRQDQRGSTPINSADSHPRAHHTFRLAPGDKLDGPSGALALLCPSDPCLQKSHFLQRLFAREGRHRIERLLVKGPRRPRRPKRTLHRHFARAALHSDKSGSVSFTLGTHPPTLWRHSHRLVHTRISPAHPTEPPLTCPLPSSATSPDTHFHPVPPTNPLTTRAPARPAGNRERESLLSLPSTLCLTSGDTCCHCACHLSISSRALVASMCSGVGVGTWTEKNRKDVCTVST
jgi:hypothetical protein